MLRATLCVFALATIVVGCTNKDSGPSSPGGEVAQEGECPAGATKNVEGGFCAVLGGDLQPSPPSGSEGDRRYAYGNHTSSVVVVVKSGHVATDELWNARRQALAEEVARYGGVSKSYEHGVSSVSSVWKEADGRLASTTLLRGDGRIVECRAVSREPVPLQACQSIRLL